ncbi:hypothetical protein M8C21_006603 [Ambrosia artemisiifolia]|uniref:Uncharacterized protein n=1 Tax=Ambrosia artemisiifolia TaxID=4212 RepID=A0AAD5C4Q2_AMBAR|nr:hypothetical protein M8C21_006603 [Ambrosia artemisiifolia]
MPRILMAQSREGVILILIFHGLHIPTHHQDILIYLVECIINLFAYSNFMIRQHMLQSILRIMGAMDTPTHVTVHFENHGSYGYDGCCTF